MLESRLYSIYEKSENKSMKIIQPTCNLTFSRNMFLNNTSSLFSERIMNSFLSYVKNFHFDTTAIYTWKY